MTLDQEVQKMKQLLDTLEMHVMLPSESEEKDPIKKWMDERESVKKFIDTISFWVTDSYLEGIKAVFKEIPENKNIVDYNFIETAKLKDIWVETMTTYLEDRVLKYFGINEKDDLKTPMLMKSTIGLSSHDLKNIIDEYGKDYTLQKHNLLTELLEEKITKRLYTDVGAHLNDEHVEDVIKCIESLDATHFLDVKNMSIKDALEMYDLYAESNGLFTPKYIKDHFVDKKQEIPKYLTIIPP